jgi:hypothetical protein
MNGHDIKADVGRKVHPIILEKRVAVGSLINIKVKFGIYLTTGIDINLIALVVLNRKVSPYRCRAITAKRKLCKIKSVSPILRKAPEGVYSKYIIVGV